MSDEWIDTYWIDQPEQHTAGCLAYARRSTLAVGQAFCTVQCGDQRRVARLILQLREAPGGIRWRDRWLKWRPIHEVYNDNMRSGRYDVINNDGSIRTIDINVSRSIPVQINDQLPEPGWDFYRPVPRKAT